MCFIQMLQICLLCVNKNFLLTYLLTYLCFIRVCRISVIRIGTVSLY